MISHPPLNDRQPGDPIKSEDWNNLIVAVKTVYEFLNRERGWIVVQAREQGSGTPVRVATVTAKPAPDDGRPARAGVLAGAGIDAYLVSDLVAGGYEVVVEAPGYATQTRAVTVASGGGPTTVAVDLPVTEARVPAPNLLGLALGQALANLDADGLAVARIVDSFGNDIAPGAVPADAQTAPVLGQWPIPSTPITKTTQLFIHVSAKAIKWATVPDVRGLSIEEAKATLEAAGLVIGETKTAKT